MKQPSKAQIQSLEKLIGNFVSLAKRSPNVAYLLDVTPGDISKVEALVKKLKEDETHQAAANRHAKSR